MRRFSQNLINVITPLLFAGSLMFLASSLASAVEGRRVALVVGNGAYRHTAPLANPKADAEAMAAALRRSGFEVVLGLDLDKRGMDSTIRQFSEKLVGADVGMFFYAGHGLQVSGNNYLVPIDAELTTASALDFEMTRLDLVQRVMERSVPTNLIFLDACRDNPLARNLARTLGTRSAGIGRGLAKVQAGVGTLISFSTQPGNVALDGKGRHSPYAGALINELTARPGDLADMLIQVRRKVIRETNGKQVPWEHSSLTTRFSFAPPRHATSPSKPANGPATNLTFEQRAELAFWQSVNGSKDPNVIATYVARYPNGTFAGLARVMIARLQKTSEITNTQPSVQRSNPVTVPTDRPAPTPPAFDRKQLVRDIQRRLARVGCDPGPIDGGWGPSTRRALRKFAERTGKTGLTSPTEAVNTALAATKGRVCPSSPASAANQKRPPTRTRPKPKRTKPKSSEGVCMSHRNRVVSCDDPTASYRLN